MKVYINDGYIKAHKMTIQQYNSGTDLLEFIIPRYDDIGNDLSTCTPSIITNHGQDKIASVEGTDDLTMTFDEKNLVIKWIIKSKTTEVAKEICYQISLHKDTELLWHSTMAVLQIVQSLSDEPIAINYPTLLQQWEERMNALDNKCGKTLVDVTDQVTAAELLKDQAQSAKNTAVEQAQAASISKDATKSNVAETERLKQEAERHKQEAEQANAACKAAEMRVITLMSTDTRSYFFTTLAERDTANELRDCDRCSVLETRADYIYDMHDRDGNEISPEWIKTADWDALKTVAWAIITDKPNFATVALSGSYNDLINKPNRYEQFITLTDANWDYSLSDKAICTLKQDTAINITNLYNGAVGLIKVYGGNLILPINSKKSVDFDYIYSSEEEHYTYTFLYDGTTFCWSRTVCVNG